MPFTDNFNGEASNTDLANRTPSGGTAWTRVGTEDAIFAHSAFEVARADESKGKAYYYCDDQGSADHYTQGVMPTLAEPEGAFVCIRLVDADNFIGWHSHGVGSVGTDLVKYVSGTETELIQTQGTPGNTYRAEGDGTDISWFENGSQIGTTQTVTEHQTETKQGFVSLPIGGVEDLCDDFEAGALSSGTSTEVPTGSLSYTGFAPTVAAGGNVSVEVPVGALTYTGFAPAAGSSVTVTVPVGSVSYSGFAPTVTAGTTIEVPAGSISYTGQAPTVSVTDNITIDVPVGSLGYTGLAPSVSVTSSVNITVPVGSVTYTGLVPSVVALSGKVGALEFSKPLSTALEFSSPLGGDLAFSGTLH